MERVQYQIERTLPQLQLLDEGGLFTKTQLNAVTTQRRQYEARLVSHAPALDDFVHYANYEQNLFELITIKSRRLELSSHWRKQNDTYHSAHIISIWERLVTKHQHNVHAWTSYIQWADKRKMRVVVSRVYARALALHPTDVPLWLNAASHELNANMSTTSARTLLQRAIRINALPWKRDEPSSPSSSSSSSKRIRTGVDTSSAVHSTSASTSATPASGPVKLKLSAREANLLRLWVEYFRMELVFVERLRRRWLALGFHWQGDEEQQSGATSSANDAAVADAAQSLQDDAEADNTETSLLSQVPQPAEDNNQAQADSASPSKPNTYTKRAPAGIPEAQLPILRGSIPVVLLANALSTLAPQLHYILLLSLLELFRHFPFADASQAAISRSNTGPRQATDSGHFLRRRLLASVYDALADRERWGWVEYLPVGMVSALRELCDSASEEREDDQDELENNTRLAESSKLQQSALSDALLDLAELVRQRNAADVDVGVHLVLALLEPALGLAQGSGALPRAIKHALSELQPLCRSAPQSLKPRYYTALTQLLTFLTDHTDEANLVKYLEAVYSATLTEARKAGPGVETASMRAAHLRRSKPSLARIQEALQAFPSSSEIWALRIERADGQHEKLHEWRRALQACESLQLWDAFLAWLQDEYSHLRATQSAKAANKWREEQFTTSLRDTAAAISRPGDSATRQAIHDAVLIAYVQGAPAPAQAVDTCLSRSLGSLSAWQAVCDTYENERVHRHILRLAESDLSAWKGYLAFLARTDLPRAMETLDTARRACGPEIEVAWNQICQL